MVTRKPITPNPGGNLTPDEVVGRERTIGRYWDILQKRGIVLLAPRRVGKSSLCQAMVQKPPPGFRVVYRSLEGKASSPLDLARALLDDTESILGRGTRTAARARKWLAAVGQAVDTTWVHLAATEDWRNLLDAIFEDLAEWACQNDQVVVLFWDEFTVFLHDLAAPSHAAAREAMTLLDRLRAARQQHSRIRMVYTGSIGLDEVLRSLRQKGYANEPTNDMAKEILPLLEMDDAIDLTERLLASFLSEPALIPNVAPHIALLCEGHPFLVQHVADHLRVSGHAVPGADGWRNAADLALQALLEDPGDPLELSHFHDRLEGYLDEASTPVALDVLDALALSSEALPLDELSRQCGNPDREALLHILTLLRRDLYLDRKDGRWSFRLSFLRRFWALERGLSCS